MQMWGEDHVLDQSALYSVVALAGLDSLVYSKKTCWGESARVGEQGRGKPHCRAIARVRKVGPYHTTKRPMWPVYGRGRACPALELPH